MYTGVVVEDDVFVRSSCVLMNFANPDSYIVRPDLYEETILRRGVMVGVSATIVSGTVFGRYYFVSAGAEVTKASAVGYAVGDEIIQGI